MVKESLEQIKTLAEDAIVKLPGELAAAKAEGFAEGAASVGSDKIYSQEQADALVAEAVAKKEEELQKKISDLETLLASEQEKVAALKAAIQVEIDDSKVDTTRLESALV